MNLGGSRKALRKNQVGLLAGIEAGLRFKLTRLGTERCPKLRGRTGTVVSVARNSSGFRVQFDGAKSPQSLHRTYIMPIDADEPT